MNIKQSVTLLLLLMGVSFSAFSASFYKVTGPAGFYSYCDWPFSTGDIISSDFNFSFCVGNVAEFGRVVKRVEISNSMIMVVYGNNYRGMAVNLQPVSSCPAGQELNNGKCEEPPPSCADTADGHVVEGQTWPYKTYGNDPRVCARGCIYKLHVLSLCFPEGGFCTGDMIGTSEECTNDGIEPGNNTPDPCEPKEGGGYSCNKDIDGDGQPDADGGLDPDADCGFDSQGKFGCTGGSYDKDPTPEQPDPNHTPDDPTSEIPDPSPLPDDTTSTPTPDPVDPTPDVPTPTPTPDGNGDVVQAITNLNRDVNKSINDMNIDINKANANIENELNRLNQNTRANTQAIKDMHQANIDIAENNKALIQQANADITTAVNTTTNAVNDLGGKIDGLGADLESIDGSLTGIGETLDGIGTALDGMANTDTSGAGTGGTCIASDNCTGFYTSSYPDGLEGVFTDHFSDVSTKVTDSLTGMFELDLSGASRPKFGLPVPFYGWFYFDDYINLDWIFAFVRVCMMVTTAFTCRKLLFGG
ncbi:methyl-accepting chemotaxis protein [Vibrio cidicii]|uniref:methyl-accepting chemotaxis protein n=1 Tax=Vibrio cidicii TaxID=1763883 RepID=UPI003750F87E